MVGILVSKSLGNSRVDQAIASAEWSNLKQGDNESVLQYKLRTTNLLSTLKIVGLKDIPPADQAVVFTLGLNKGFESLLAHLSNMQAMGTDQYERAEPADSFLLFSTESLPWRRLLGLSRTDRYPWPAYC